MDFPRESVLLLCQVVANPNAASAEERGRACEALAAYARMKIDTTGQQVRPKEEEEAFAEAMPTDSRQLLLQRLLAWSKTPEDNGISFAPPWGLVYRLALMVSWGQ